MASHIRRHKQPLNKVFVASLACGFVLLAVSLVLYARTKDSLETEDSSGEYAELLKDQISSVLDDQNSTDAVTSALAGAKTEVFYPEGDLEAVAAKLLEEYESYETCVLAYSGYADFTGNTWACVVEGLGWVDICIVQNNSEKVGSCVVCLHMDAEDLDF